MKVTDLEFLNYIQELTKSELKGLNHKLSLDPMPLTYSINGDSYIKYLHEIKRNGKTLIVNNNMFTFKNNRYSLKGRNFGILNFNELKENRVLEY